MKKILVPCDFSDPAVQAFKFACNIARKSGGEILLLHVIELPVLYDTGAVLTFEEAYLKDRKAEADKNFAKMKEKWAMDIPGFQTMVEYGGAVPVIRKLIHEKKVDLVIIGTHGASGLKEFAIGSNAEKIVRTSEVPVIAIKKETPEIKNIIFPTSPDIADEELLKKVKEVQDFFGARLHILFVNTPASFRRDSETRPALEAMAKKFDLRNFSINICNDISEEEGIAAFSKEVMADMVAMRTHGRRGLAHLATGSIAEDLVNHINCPIWTFKIK
ncbi:MAG: universal stress protein [Bacteroidetes bacterium]|nr:universal stress protein [Bacteroidota bacterium]